MVMNDSFQITLLNRTRLWPAVIFPKESDSGHLPERDLESIIELLERDGCIYVQSVSYDEEGAQVPFRNGLIHKKDVHYIQGPIPTFDSKSLSVYEVFSLSDAASYWGLPDGSTIRKSISRGTFRELEGRKSDW